jgi:hypothetical protein
MSDQNGAVHGDPELNAVLGAFVIAGGELDGASPDYIWAYCQCDDETHAVLVLRNPLGRDYVRRKVGQMVNHPCLGAAIRKGGEL